MKARALRKSHMPVDVRYAPTTRVLAQRLRRTTSPHAECSWTYVICSMRPEPFHSRGLHQPASLSPVWVFANGVKSRPFTAI